MPDFEPPDDLALVPAPCGLLVTNGSGTIVQCNSTFAAWVGKNARELVGQTLASQLTMGARIFHQTHWVPLLQLQGSVSEVKLDFRHEDGSKVPMIVNAQVVLGGTGQIYHSVACFAATDRDVYEKELLRARAEAMDLLQTTRSLREAAVDRSLFAEQMIGIVSHDLRNPLTAIRMGAEMLSLDENDPKRLRLAGRINQSVNRALDLITDLLDFTLTRTGRQLNIARSRFDFRQAMAAGIDELRMAFPEADLVHLHKGASWVQADQSRLVQVLGNLVGNARRYGQRGGRITVFTSVHSGQVSLSVHNLGLPIAEELLPTLFKAMTRGSHTHDAGGGVGLGLYIVSEIAKGHGGTTFARSDATGTQIGIEFPGTKQISESRADHAHKRNHARSTTKDTQ